MKTRGQSGGGWGGEFDLAHSWAEWDALPRGVRRLYASAPYNYTAIEAVRAMARGEDMRAFAQHKQARFERHVMRESKRLYGEVQIGYVR
ncbi:hypothetical protein SH203_02854 [Brevundimonas sp. SH203]|uniref:hypothetical protein n=1 Tax=Brevundimonas sp. SH203 TaxID=345167 RepID=UPI0009CBC652|nr:hypothetical protein [Brevundimonas sp. SH203]GAW42438.1 hypothetical protein SH203_02854 [Brevundimonas sp. SH203]